MPWCMVTTLLSMLLRSLMLPGSLCLLRGRLCVRLMVLLNVNGRLIRPTARQQIFSASAIVFHQPGALTCRTGSSSIMHITASEPHAAEGKTAWQLHFMAMTIL